MSEESKSVLGPINNGNARGKKSNPVESNLEQPVLIDERQSCKLRGKTYLLVDRHHWPEQNLVSRQVLSLMAYAGRVANGVKRIEQLAYPPVGSGNIILAIHAIKASYLNSFHKACSRTVKHLVNHFYSGAMG